MSAKVIEDCALCGTSHDVNKICRPAKDGGVTLHRHCDDYIDDHTQPDCLRWFLLVNRLPAATNPVVLKYAKNPVLFATYEGKRYRVTMASRMGDVGISLDFGRDYGYEKRVPVDLLSDFNEKPKVPS